MSDKRESRATARVSGIYTASRVHHAPIWLRYRAAGEPVISSWIDEAGDGETASFEELWDRIQGEIDGAHHLILYVEPSDFPLKGALIEVGMALASGVPVIVVAPSVVLEGRTMRPLGSWLAHRLVTRVDTLDIAFSLARSTIHAERSAAPPSLPEDRKRGDAHHPRHDSRSSGCDDTKPPHAEQCATHQDKIALLERANHRAAEESSTEIRMLAQECDTLAAKVAVLVEALKLARSYVEEIADRDCPRADEAADDLSTVDRALSNLDSGAEGRPEPGGYYACTECDHTETAEREVLCWKCGAGEMVWVRPGASSTAFFAKHSRPIPPPGTNALPCHWRDDERRCGYKDCHCLGPCNGFVAPRFGVRFA